MADDEKIRAKALEAIGSLGDINPYRQEQFEKNLEKERLAVVSGTVKPGSHHYSDAANDLMRNIELVVENTRKFPSDIEKDIDALVQKTLKPAEVRQVLADMRQGGIMTETARKFSGTDPKTAKWEQDTTKFASGAKQFLEAYNKLQNAIVEGMDDALRPAPATTPAVTQTHATTVTSRKR